MRYLLIAFLLFAGSAQAQLFDRDDGDGWRRHKKVRCHCWLDEGWNSEREERRDRERRAHERWEQERREHERWGHERWRSEGREYFERHYVRHTRPRWRHNDGDEDGGGRRHERDEGYRGWRHPGREEVYRGWWRPEGHDLRHWREFESDGAHKCRPPMHAAGDADARRENARNMAIKSWQEQVINEHGERFINFSAAYVIDEHCDPARVGENNLLDLKRCVITAAPCLTPRDEDRRDEERRDDDKRK